MIEIKPLTSVGQIRFGMNREQVRTLLADVPKAFKRTEVSDEETDYFVEKGLQVIYAADGHCCAVEAMSPAEVIFRGKQIFPADFDVAAPLLAEADPQLIKDSSGVLSVSLSIGIYAPSHRENPRTPLESILAGEEGYYR